MTTIETPSPDLVDVELPDVGTIELGGGSSGHVDDLDWFAMNAALAANTIYRYPTGFPKALHPALDQVRAVLREGRSPLANGTWTWFKTASSHYPARTFVLDIEAPADRVERWVGPDVELPSVLDRITPGWRPEPAVKRTRKAPVPAVTGPVSLEHLPGCTCRCPGTRP